MSTRDDRAAIVLAGGASARFGEDKLAAVLDGRPLLHHALSAADAVAATVVLVLAPAASAPGLPPLRAQVVVANDRETHQGPLAGLAAGLGSLATVAPTVDDAILVGGDMPWLVPDVLLAMSARLDADKGLAAVLLEADPLAILPIALRPSLAAPGVATALAAGRRALRAGLDPVRWVAMPAADWRPLDPDGLTLRDVDWPADLRRR